jgi:ubiquitin-conjugating enzyme E2 variant
VSLLLTNGFRLFTSGAVLQWWAPLAIGAAAVAADLTSGVVHWTADTWGSETMPVFGRRFLRPFRVHHVNPHDFLRRDPIDCNGDVAMLNIPVLAVALGTPLDLPSGAVTCVALVAFSAVSLPTNQVHQWAHMEHPPAVVRWMQLHGLVLSREAHAAHHAPPYVRNYCIATGWCNRWLAAHDVFERCERRISRLTGAIPRADEDAFAARRP